MNYERKVVTKQEERDIITGMIVSTSFLQQCQAFCKPELLTLSYARTVAQWCMDYFGKYQKAPVADIKGIELTLQFADGEKREAITDFIQSLSQKFEGEDNFNTGYGVDKAVNYFKGLSLVSLTDRVRQSIIVGDYGGAEAVISKYKRVEKNVSAGIDVWHDKDAVVRAIRDRDDRDTLFQFPGELGKLVRPFRRRDFAVIVGPGKRGKCEIGENEVLLPSGKLKKIKDIVKDKDKKVVSFDFSKGKFVKSDITVWHDNGKQSTYKIKTRTGREITVTYNHPLYKFREGWKTIESGLSSGDYIAVPSRLNFFGKKMIPRDHVKLLAYLIADGGLTGPSVIYTKADLILKQDFKRIILNLGDIAKPCGDKNISCRVVKKNSGTLPSQTRILISGYGMNHEKSIHKTVPDVIFELKKDLVKEFLKTLFSGDGSIFKDGIEYSSGSEKLIRQVHHLLLRFGIVSKIKSKEVDNTIYWCLNIRDSSFTLKFIDEIGFYGKKNKRSISLLSHFENKKQRSYLDVIPSTYFPILKRKIENSGIHRYSQVFKTILYPKKGINSNLTKSMLEKVNKKLKDEEIKNLLSSDILWDKIESIEYMGKENTYDITAPEHSNFVSNDIISHNSFILTEVAFLCSLMGFNVLFFSFEMPEEDILLRLYQRITGQVSPVGNDEKDSCEVSIPYFSSNGGVDHVREKRKIVNIKDVFQKIEGIKVMAKSGRFKLECAPSGSMSVPDMLNKLDNLEHYDDFVPDVIITDYADITRSENRGEKRHQIDEIWLGHRFISQERNCLVLTASHSNKATFDRDIRQGDLSEDYRKLNHVTWAGALNQNEEENEQGIMRLSVLADRYQRFNGMNEAKVLQCLDIGQVCLDSRVVRKDSN